MEQIPPTIVVKGKDVKGREAAAYLETIVNQQAQSGWEFFRVDEVGVLEVPGCLWQLLGKSADLRVFYVVTFRRQV
jgi:hypothetical protein